MSSTSRSGARGSTGAGVPRAGARGPNGARVERPRHHTGLHVALAAVVLVSLVASAVAVGLSGAAGRPAASAAHLAAGGPELLVPQAGVGYGGAHF